MRPFIFSIVFLFTTLFAKAQHNHFIYLQTDNKQSFYVRVKETIYSSSTSGYLIIPKMQAGTYNLSVGFPKNEFAAQTIPVTISGKDLGYLLKNFEGKGWGLFNIQTMDVIMSTTATSSSPAAKPETKSDDFSNTLADVVNTPSIKDVKKEEPKEEKKTAPAKADEPVAAVTVVNKQETAKAIETKPEKVKEMSKASGVIKKISFAQTGEAAIINYLLSDDSGSDTVNVVIPLDKTVLPAPGPVEKGEATITEPVKKKITSKETGEPKFIEIDLPAVSTGSIQNEANTDIKTESAPKPIGTAVKDTDSAAPALKMINSDCKSVATEDDFMKTRKKMTAQKSDDGMVEAARKLFKQKCFSTEQVKNLSVLFLKDEGKYKFFDAVYPFVYDSREFKRLESQLSEEYYISRFRSMIRN